MRVRVAWIACCLFATAEGVCQTPTASFAMTQGSLSKFASAVGSFNGDAGNYSFVLLTPCFPDFWHLCKKVLYSNDLLWVLSNPSFSIDSSGATFNGSFSAHYGSFSYNSPVSGAVSLRWDSAQSAIDFSIAEVKVPVTINLPLFGAWRITTLTVTPNYGFNYPLTPMVTQLITPTGSNFLHVAPADIGFVYQPGSVTVNVRFSAW